MTTTTAPAHFATNPATGPAPGPGGGRARLARETWIIRRSLTRIRNEPETLSAVTIQPVMFTLLFAYVFGSAIQLGGPFGATAAYHEYLIAGLFGLTVIGTLAGTAVGMTADMETEAYTVLWAIGVVAVFAPVAVYLYRRRSRS
jgi:hypothetical protein